MPFNIIIKHFLLKLYESIKLNKKVNNFVYYFLICFVNFASQLKFSSEQIYHSRAWWLPLIQWEYSYGISPHVGWFGTRRQWKLKWVANEYGNETHITHSSGSCPIVVYTCSHINKDCLLGIFLYNVSPFHMGDQWPSDFSTIISD